MIHTNLPKVIHTNLPSADTDPVLNYLVGRLQTHWHTRYCQPRPSSRCRFQFPKRPCGSTKILSHAKIYHQRGRYYETVTGKDSLFINSYNSVFFKTLEGQYGYTADKQCKCSLLGTDNLISRGGPGIFSPVKLFFLPFCTTSYFFQK